MKKILAISASNSAKSINALTLKYLLSGASKQIDLLDLKDHHLPLYATDLEQQGIPTEARQLREKFAAYDGFIVAVPEHNASVPAFFKNLLDWVSRAGEGYRFMKGKQVLLISVSPSPSGGANALRHAEQIISVFGGIVTDKISVPSFYQNVKTTEEGISISEEYRKRLTDGISSFENIFETDLAQ